MNFRLLVSCLKMWTIALGYLLAWCSIIWSTAEKLMWCMQVYVIYCNSFSLGFQLLWMKPENLECNLKLLLGCQSWRLWHVSWKRQFSLDFPSGFWYDHWPQYLKILMVSENRQTWIFTFAGTYFQRGEKKCFVSKFQFCLMITHST